MREADNVTSPFAINLLVEAGLDHHIAGKAVHALAEAGMLVSRRHWLPSMASLHGEYRRLSEAQIHRRLPFRWVMCREAHDELVRRCCGQQVPIMQDRRHAYWRDDADPENYERMVPAVQEVVRNGYLFGINIRIDPAARSPMWEIPD